MMIDQHTTLFGVMGNPTGHTMGPIMHNAAFEATGLNAVYLAFETGDVQGSVEGIRALGVKGMSVTIPHKSSVISFLDEVDELAEKIGAVNTVVNDNGKLVGYNTDAIGALKAIEEKMDLAGKHCHVIGAGGAALAIAFILKQQGVQLSISNRSKNRGENLAKSLGCPFVPLKKIKDVQADLLVHTTPVGMYPNVDQCLISPDMLHAGTVVMDIVYNPIETRLLQTAKSRDCLTISGLHMFVHQGGEQFKLWTGKKAPVNAMRTAVKKWLRRYA
jgi:shikimate dehydrogenase